MKNKFKIFIFMCAVVISSVFSLFGESTRQASAAEWYDGAWSYRKEITLAPATAVANYQVKIELTAANFDYTKAKANGDDLRFAANDGTTLQDHWIETWVSGGTSMIWVKVVNSGTSNIYMYYGNVAVANMSTSNIFEFFDSFDDGDVSDWTAATYYQTISSSSSIDSSYLASPEYSFKMYAKANCWNAPYSGAEIRMSKTIALPNGNYIADFYQKFIGTRDRACAWGNTSNYLYFYINNTIRFTRNCSGACTAIITCDTQSSTSDFFQITTGSAKISLSARPTDCSYSTSWFDDVRIRKYVSPEPVANIGSESSLPPPLSTCDSFTATPSFINLGDSSTLTWTTSNATSVTIDNEVASTTPNDSETVSPVTTTTYNLTAFNDAGDTATCSVTVTVTAPLPPPAAPASGGGHMNLTKFDKDVVEVFKDASSFLLSIIGGLALLVIVIGGILYIFSGSNPEAQNKAKGTVTKAIIGLALVLVSYGVVSQTSQVVTDEVATSPPICYWECSDWSVCVAGSQNRVCAESCGAVVGSPVVIRSCAVPPASFDWSHQVLPAALPVGGANWMTSVKDQSVCGSCWAFATLGYIEAIYNIENGNPALDINLSEQDLISCSAGNCSGWSLPETTDHIQDIGVVSQSCFEYSASNEECSVPNKCATWAAQLWKIVSWSITSSNNQQSIKEELVNRGPVLAGMNMSTWNAVTLSCTSSIENHAVVIVGYDDAGGYWIVKNSHGSTWNGNGYFKVKYGQCGLESGMTVEVENVFGP